ncbi:MAG: potassium transporter Kup [Betaproteobacteria bacterium]|nr:potassium transporter Kup [Betaproteobacteria bacterium]
MTDTSAHDAQLVGKQTFFALTLAALGVVYGDIGTSPLYTMQVIFSATYHIALTRADMLGVLSVLFWTLMLVVSFKYVLFIMRADNEGEGGIMALMAIAMRKFSAKGRALWLVMVTGLLGVSLFYGDGVITPAISVLSAVEGLEIAAPELKRFVVPVTLTVLLALFSIQRKGTARVGGLFGPVMVVWFAALAILGLLNILHAPQVLLALNPYYAAQFFARFRAEGFLALGAIILAVTGAEALYADMGHFGRRPIRTAWFWYVMPALVVNYFGQGALLLHDPAALRNPFYLLAPAWALYPMVALATLATVIASQAVISGAFSLTRQAVQLGYAPRLRIVHTSTHEIGQIYMPWVNWTLFLAVAVLVIGFGSSDALANAYGMAVTGTMVVTTLLAVIVVRHLWGWSWLRSGAVIAFFLTIDVAYFSANAVKFFQGGWFPVAIGLGVFILMTTWHRGRELLFERLRADTIPLEAFIASLTEGSVPRVPGTAIFLTTNLQSVPHSLLHNLAHNKILHERVVILTVRTRDVPSVPEADRIEAESLPLNFYRVTLRYGFKDSPNIPQALEACRQCGIDFDLQQTSFFLTRETLVPTVAARMAFWREKLFVMLARNNASATAFFGIPTNRVVELGTQIEL